MVEHYSHLYPKVGDVLKTTSEGGMIKVPLKVTSIRKSKEFGKPITYFTLSGKKGGSIIVAGDRIVSGFKKTKRKKW